MKHNNAFDSLFEADDQTIDRIAAQCEPDWDEERIFERSYRKYQAKRQGAILRLPRRTYHDPLRAAVTAACLMIALGGAGSIWFFRYGVQNPQMTIDVETAPTETTAVTGSTAETTTTETRIRTTAAPKETVPVVLGSDAALHTTVSVSYTVTVPVATAAAASTAFTSNSTPQTTAASRQTTQIATAPEPLVTAAPAQQAPETAHRQETQSVTTPIEPTTAAAAVPTESTEETTEPTSADNPPGADVPPSGDTNPNSEDIFTFRDGQNIIIMESRTDKTSPPLDDIAVQFNSDGLTLTDQSKSPAKSREIKLENPDTGEQYYLFVYPYNGYGFSYKPEGFEREKITVNGRTGYSYCFQESADDKGRNMRYLIWDNGTCIAMLTGLSSSPDEIAQIGTSLTFTSKEEVP